MSEEEKPSTSKKSTATGSSDAAAAAGDAETTIMEFNVRVVNNGPKKHHIMRFHEMEKIDFTKWRDVTMEREDNRMEFSGGAVDNMPKYGAGSEYNRDNREAARRRRKYGTTKDKKYRPEDQPWLLNVGGKNGKKYKGRRAGGVNANADYYVMVPAADGTYVAHPVHEWYDFQPIQRYKTLTAEEAEQEFRQREKTMNYFSQMFRNRLKVVEEEQDAELDKDDDDEAKKDGGDGEKVKDKGAEKKRKEIKLPEMEEWMLDSDEQSKSEDEDNIKATKVNKINNKKNDENTKSPSAKKTKHEVAAASLPATFAGVVKANKEGGITEEAVRRYLMRKPLTTTELLAKFKNKKGKMSNEQLLETMSRVLKKINPTQQTIQGKLYLSVKKEDKKNKK